jgi:hypothetical protein
MRLPLLSSLVFAFVAMSASAQRGVADEAAPAHGAPVPVRLWMRDGSVRNASLIAQAATMDARPDPQMRFRTNTGEIGLWMDTLLSISDVTDKSNPADSSALFRLDRGQPRRLRFGNGTEHVLIENTDGTREIVDLTKIARLQTVRRAAVAKVGAE